MAKKDDSPEPVTQPVSDFKGLDKRYLPGPLKEWTGSLDGVEIRNGRIIGMQGLAKWNGFTTAETDTPILGFMPLVLHAGATTVTRMSPLKVKQWNGSTWADITGTALTGSSTVLPQYCMMQNNLVFTNGVDLPRKWSGTGNTATIGGGSNPPYCKAIAPYKGFLFLGNTSLDGTFTDLTDGYRTLYFSSDWDTDWSACDVNTMVIDETPGDVVWLGQSGDLLLVGKIDGIVAVRFVGGATRFVKERIQFDKGMISPLSVRPIGQGGWIFLATDLQLYVVAGAVVKPLPQNVTSILQDTMTASNARTSRAETDIYKTIYHLLYNRTGGTWNDGRISFNYTTGEFYHRSYSAHAFTNLAQVKLSASTDPVLLASSTTLVYQLDTAQYDEGTTVPSRYYDLDWSHYGQAGEKYFMGCDLVVTRKAAVRFELSVATDFSGTFQFKQSFSGLGRDIDSGQTLISYRLPSPIYGTYFKLRVTPLHDGATNVGEILSISPVILPVHPKVRENTNTAVYPSSAGAV